MKKLVFLAVIAVMVLANALPAMAQYNDIYRKGAKLYSSDDVLLTAEQISAMMNSVEGLSYETWVKNTKGFKAGKGLLIASGSLTGAGIVTLGIGAVGMMMEGIAVGIGVTFVAPLASLSGEELEVAMDSKFRGVAIAGLAMTGTGIAGLITGTTVYCVYKKRLNNMVDSCNSASHLNVSLGMQQHGVGLAVNF